jgi:hypothetical protein
MLTVGDTLHIQSGASKHLFAVILGPVVIENRGSTKHYILVNFSTIHPADNHDAACEVQAGDHPNIRHASYVFYRRALIEREDDVLNAIRLGSHKQAAPCSKELISKIKAGALTSLQTSREIKALLRQ